MFEERILREKTIELYKMLTHSDFNGNYEDGYTIEQLFTMLCLDLALNSGFGPDQKPGPMKPKEMFDLAKEIIRIVETENIGLSNYSIMNWTRATLSYMSNNDKKYNDIHRMSTVDLKKEIGEYLQKDGD
ncbi:MAG: hypothetical protein IJI92_00035 [Erysipelotrichaceae bacterium]|nr:hypothetical protein [Erysipelotrichaceae bacterium]